MLDNLLTPEEVADRLSVKVTTVREWLKKGELTGVKLGRVWRVREKDLETFVDSKARKGD
jgi:excisionase family DNA binding protein